MRTRQNECGEDMKSFTLPSSSNGIQCNTGPGTAVPFFSSSLAQCYDALIFECWNHLTL